MDLTLREALRFGEQYLAQRGIADAAVDAWLLLEYVTGLTRAQYLACADEPLGVPAVLPGEHSAQHPARAGGSVSVSVVLSGEHSVQHPARAGEPAAQGSADSERLFQRYRELLEKRSSHIPLQHLTGEQEFMGLPFYVNEHVLIPRQDTETLAEEALKRLRADMKVLDLCTGSGCIALSLAKLGPKIRVDASDISREALAVAEKNARRLGVRVRLIHSDLFSGIAGPYDMIVSNPPYIRTSVIEELSEEVRLHEPFQALDGREDGLYFYRRIIKEGKSRLSENGWLLLEIGYDQAEEVASLLAGGGFREIMTVRDLAGHDRVVTARA